jgi:hypothetical protein
MFATVYHIEFFIVDPIKQHISKNRATAIYRLTIYHYIINVFFFLIL